MSNILYGSAAPPNSPTDNGFWLIKKDRSICRFYDQYEELLCFSQGGVHSISIRKDNLSYVISFLSVRAFEEGGSPIGVSYGKCEVF